MTWQVPMDVNPEIATQLGRLVAHWGSLEGQLVGVLGWLLRTDQFRARMVFNTFPAFFQKLGLMERLAYSYIDEGPGLQTLLAFLSRTKELANVRNAMVHGAWVAGNSKEELSLFEAALPHNTQQRYKPLKSYDPAKMATEVSRVAKLTEDIALFMLEEAQNVQVNAWPPR